MCVGVQLQVEYGGVIPVGVDGCGTHRGECPTADGPEVEPQEALAEESSVRGEGRGGGVRTGGKVLFVIPPSYLWSSICMLTQCSVRSACSPFLSSLVFLPRVPDFFFVSFVRLLPTTWTQRRAAWGDDRRKGREVGVGERLHVTLNTHACNVPQNSPKSGSNLPQG